MENHRLSTMGRLLRNPLRALRKFGLASMVRIFLRSRLKGSRYRPNQRRIRRSRISSKILNKRRKQQVSQKNRKKSRKRCLTVSRYICW